MTTMALPRAERWLRALAYVAVGAIAVWVGVEIITERPESASGLPSQLGIALATTWTLCLAAAFPAAYAAVRGRYRAEFTLLPVFTLALIIAAVFTWARVFTGETHLIGSAAITTSLCFKLGLRYWMLYRLVRSAPPVPAPEPGD